MNVTCGGAGERTHPLVSVVIPNHNYARYVGAAIESALAQSWERLEVVVVDDGSKDASRAVIRSFGDRVRPVFQENRGHMAANNAGYLASRGDVVIFLDADDLLRPDAAARAAAAMQPGVAAVQFCLATIDGEGRALGGIYPPLPPDWTPARIHETVLRSGFYPFPPSTGNAYARTFLDRVMPIDADRFPRATDGALNTLAPLYGDVVVLREALGSYRIHGGNMGALDALDPEKFSYFLDLDRKRAELLGEHAALLGVAIPRDFLDRAFFHLQYRIASLKLRPDLHPYPGDGLLRAAWLLACAARIAPEPPLTRGFVALWGLAVACSPRGWAQELVALRFIAGKRPAGLDNLLRTLGLVRRTRGSAAAAAGRN